MVNIILEVLMYDYRCKDYDNLGQNMPMESMPMMNMPMMNMPMYDDDDDEDLRSMYPKIYIRIYPMVKQHCDMLVARYGTMYCPGKDEMDYICNKVCDNYEKYYSDDEDHEHRNDDDDMRQGRRFSRGGIGDLSRILLIGDLLGRRRERFFDHEFNHDHGFDHGDHGFHHGY